MIVRGQAIDGERAGRRAIRRSHEASAIDRAAAEEKIAAGWMTLQIIEGKPVEAQGDLDDARAHLRHPRRVAGADEIEDGVVGLAAEGAIAEGRKPAAKPGCRGPTHHLLGAAGEERRIDGRFGRQPGDQVLGEMAGRSQDGDARHALLLPAQPYSAATSSAVSGSSVPPPTNMFKNR